MAIPESESYADLAEAVLALAREIQLREREVAGAVSLTSSTSHVLRYVNDHPGAKPSEAAAATGLRRSNLSTALRELEKLGFLERTPHEDDGRGVRLQSTEAAGENVAALRDLWSNDAASVLDDVAGVDDATALLRKLARGLANNRREAALRERGKVV